MLQKYINKVIKKIPYTKKLIHQRDQLHTELLNLKQEKDQLYTELLKLKRACGFVPPGHFYSPIPALEEIKKNEKRIWVESPRSVKGINLQEEKQLELFNEFVKYYQELPFSDHKSSNLRYFFKNSAYSYSDAICLYSMIRYAKPKRIVEIGSGYSSCVTLDTNELFFNGTIQTTFIEPSPALLLSLINIKDQTYITVINERLQDVDDEIFSSLEGHDILFIDSTHTGKIGSDVTHIFTEILPKLQSGVYIHFHDIFYPFEYPKQWIYEGRAWNEAYMLRNFLQYNDAFEIVFFNTFLERFHETVFAEKMPLCLKNPGGSLWIRKR